MKIKNISYLAHMLVIFLISVLLASGTFAFSDVVRHVYYGKNCSLQGGKKNCDGWKIKINVPQQDFVGQPGAELRYTADAGKNEKKDGEIGFSIGAGIGGMAATAMPGILSGLSVLGVMVIVCSSIGMLVGMGTDLMDSKSNEEGHICIKDPWGIERCWPISIWFVCYIEHDGPTGNILLNNPDDGDITINGSSWLSPN